MDDERYRLILEATVDYAIFHLGLDGIIESWNPGAERIFGFAAQEIVGRHGSVLFVPEDVFRGEPEREMKFAAETGRAQDSRWHQRKERFSGAHIDDFLPKPFLPDQLAAKVRDVLAAIAE